MGGTLFDEIRARCREVAEGARWVAIDRDALPGYAAALPVERLRLPEMDPAIHYLGHGSATLAFCLTLNAVNFGSGYFPDIFGPRRSGYRSTAAALTDHFAAWGPIPAKRLRTLSAADCAALLRLPPDIPAAAELSGLYAGALNDLGALLCDRFGGDCAALVEEAGGSARRLVELLAQMPLYRDVSRLEGTAVPFYKRAQLAAVDLSIAFDGEGPGRFADLDRITICADNLVPHVLRLDGVLRYREELAGRVDRGEPLQPGSREEVEIRACAVHAAELVVAHLQGRGEPVNAMLLDNLLWHRGQLPQYRDRPRHRTRTPFY